MRISDWSSDVCSSDLAMEEVGGSDGEEAEAGHVVLQRFPGGEGFGGDGARIDEHRLGAGRGIAEPVAALDGAFLPTVVGALDLPARAEIGRASGRDRVCQYV